MEKQVSLLSHDLSYRQSLEVLNIPTLYDRREAIGDSMFQEISNNNNDHKLYSLLLPPYLGTLPSRKNRKFQDPRFKTIVSETVLLQGIADSTSFYNSYILNDTISNVYTIIALLLSISYN